MEPTDHYLYLARLVRTNIAAANYGTYPTTPDEWYEIARRLGVAVRVLPGYVGGACLLDDLLLHATGPPEQVARYMAHELAEERLRSECEPPFILPGTGSHFHRIARIVEVLRDDLPP